MFITWVTVLNLYQMTPDRQYIIDRHPTQRNIIIGGGFSGTGFKAAIATGGVLARMVTDETTDVDNDVQMVFSLHRS